MLLVSKHETLLFSSAEPVEDESEEDTDPVTRKCNLQSCSIFFGLLGVLLIVGLAVFVAFGKGFITLRLLLYST